MKTFGQVAHEAYCATREALGIGSDLPVWELLAPSIKEAWEAAAVAAINHAGAAVERGLGE